MNASLPRNETAKPYANLTHAVAGQRYLSLLLALALLVAIATASGCRLTTATPGTRVSATASTPTTGTASTASHTLSLIADLSAASAGRRVTIQGEVFDVERHSGGNIKLTCLDDTGEITVFIPVDVGIDALVLTTGETYRISGSLQTYRDQLELVPELPDDIDRIQSGTSFPSVQVTSVVDGDTLHVRYDDGRQEKVRMIGIDCPELARDGQAAEFYAEQARDYVTALLLAKTVYLEQDYSDTDRYGRQLRYVWLKQPDRITAEAVQMHLVSSILLSQGYATFVEIGLDNKYEIILRDHEKQAREDHLGLWSD